MTKLATMEQELARDRRRGILEHLAVADGKCLPAGVLTELLSHGRHNIFRDVIESDCVLMAQHGLVTVEQMPSMAGPQKWVTSTGLGLDVAKGRSHPLVAEKLPGY